MPEPGRCVGGFIPPNHQAMHQACMVFQTLLVLLEPVLARCLPAATRQYHMHMRHCVCPRSPLVLSFRMLRALGTRLGIYAEAWHATNEGIEAKACMRRCGW